MSYTKANLGRLWHFVGCESFNSIKINHVKFGEKISSMLPFKARTLEKPLSVIKWHKSCLAVDLERYMVSSRVQTVLIRM